jgi:hypothetical protein
MRERAEQRFVQQLITQAAIEAFDEGILLRLAGRNVVPPDLSILRPAQLPRRVSVDWMVARTWDPLIN